MIDLAAYVSMGFKALAVKLGQEAATFGFNALLSQSDKAPQLNFDEHLERTFQRCTTIRTLLNRDKPVELLDQYVNLKFRCNDEIIDDYDLIEKVSILPHLTISGTGGGGKTVFTRYLWISFFVRPPSGRIPLYIELRRLNNFTTDNLFEYIFQSAFSAGQKKSARELFENAVKDGRFAFILDGFDEVQDDQKSSIEKQILDISHRYSQNIFVVSGRPDERYNSWQSFTHFRVEPMSKKQVIALIDKVDFDKQTKKKFIDRIDKDLFQEHSSFLSTPLLATMMLLTFDSYADIPEKIHVFYEQAFATLFARHDATKENFKRNIKSGLSIDLFQKHFACFCMLTYLKQTYEFSETQIMEYLKTAKGISQVVVDEKAFYEDLKDSVCMLAVDGTKSVFTHRSFQEYFAAFYGSKLPPEKASLVLRGIASRDMDTTFQMMFDMNTSLVEESYFLPFLERLGPIAQKLRREFSLAAFLRDMKLSMQLYKVRRIRDVKSRTSSYEAWGVHIFDDNGVVHFISKAMQCYANLDINRGEAWLKDYETRSVKSAKFLTGDRLLEERRQGDKKLNAKSNDSDWYPSSDAVKVCLNGKWQVSKATIATIESWYRQTGDYKFQVEQLNLIAKCAKFVESRRKERDDSFETILKELSN